MQAKGFDATDQFDRLNEPDVIVIFAWNFADDIVGKLKGQFDKPVELIVPLPNIRTIKI